MTTAIYGVGAMGGAILDGLTAGGDGEVLAVVRTPERAAELRERYADRPGVEVVDALAAAARADVHLVVVKPYAVADLLAQVRDSLRPGSVVVSLALGVSLADLAAALPDGVAAVRGMPNTPARVGQGMTVLSPAADVTAEQLAEWKSEHPDAVVAAQDLGGGLQPVHLGHADVHEHDVGLQPRHLGDRGGLRRRLLPRRRGAVVSWFRVLHDQAGA